MLAGSSFKTRAVIYSDDRGSASSGGFYKINRKTQFVKEFKDVAFSLGEGEVSEPFETEYGYHIIMVEKIKGQEVELRHILMMPKVSDQALKDAKEKTMTIKRKIENGFCPVERRAESGRGRHSAGRGSEESGTWTRPWRERGYA